VSEASVPTDRIHQQAERLEHFTSAELQRQLNEQTDAPRIDPHGRPIPPAKQAE
jgi:Mn-dependent DtxR family transcriptional regulator